MQPDSGPSSDLLMVTWRQFVVTIIPMFTLPVAITWALVNAHAAIPIHEGAVHVREFERVVTELRDTKMELQQLRTEIVELRRLLLEGVRRPTEKRGQRFQSHRGATYAVAENLPADCHSSLDCGVWRC